MLCLGKLIFFLGGGGDEAGIGGDTAVDLNM